MNPMSAASSSAAIGTTVWGQGLVQHEVLSYQSQVTTAVPATETTAATTRTSLQTCTVSMSPIHLDSWGNVVFFRHKAEILASAAGGIIPRLTEPLPRYFNVLSNVPIATLFVNIPVASYQLLCGQLEASQRRRAAARTGSTQSQAAKKAAAATDDKVVASAAAIFKELSSAGLLPSSVAEASQGQAEEALKAVYGELMDTLTRSYGSTHRQRSYLLSARDGLSQPCKCADSFHKLALEWEEMDREVIGTTSSSPTSAEVRLTLSEQNPYKAMIAECLSSVDRVFAKAHLLGVLQYKHGPLAHAVADELLDMRGPLHEAGHALESLLVAKSSSSSGENNPSRIKDALRKAAARLKRERDTLRGLIQ